MEKKTRLIKSIELTAIILYLLIALLLSLIQLWSQWVGYGFSLSSWIYWLILLGLIFLTWRKRGKSLTILVTAFSLFTIGVALTLIQFNQTAETLFRLSFIFWMVGITKSILEYRDRL